MVTSFSGGRSRSTRMNISGLISVIIFYVMILLVGLWAARKKKKTTDEGHLESEDVMLAGRNIGLLVIIFRVSFCSDIWYCNILTYYLGNILAYYLDN
jgi:Na+/proline symporter